MSLLTETADVQSSTEFGVPYDVQYDAAARPLIVQDLCSPANTALVAGSTSKTAIVYTIRPFGAMVSAARPNRCVPGDFPEFERGLSDDLTAEEHMAAAYVLYNGLPGWDSTAPFLLNTDVATVSAGSNTVQQLVGAVLDAFRSGQVGQDPILHLGQTAAVQLSAGNALSPAPESNEFYLAMDGTPIVVSAAYPTSLVAATGPVVVKKGKADQLVPAYEYATNRTDFASVVPMAVEFDASIAVRTTP